MILASFFLLEQHQYAAEAAGVILLRCALRRLAGIAAKDDLASTYTQKIIVYTHSTY